MDTSQEYIKMCEEAKEIQSVKLKSFNGIKHYEAGEIFSLGGNIYILGENKVGLSDKGTVWLPRQDQLQEMIKIYFPEVHNETCEVCHTAFNELFQRFHYFIHSFHTSHFLTTEWVYDTYEKYWLAFVMKNNYNKIWNKEKQIWLNP
jgi:hypothetical protein